MEAWQYQLINLSDRNLRCVAYDRRGHSLGCGEIVWYLSRHGSERVRRIVLVSPTLPYVSDFIPREVTDRVRARFTISGPVIPARNSGNAIYTQEEAPVLYPV